MSNSGRSRGMSTTTYLAAKESQSIFHLVEGHFRMIWNGRSSCDMATRQRLRSSGSKTGIRVSERRRFMFFCSVWTKVLCMSNVEKGCMGCERMRKAAKTCLMCGLKGLLQCRNVKC